MFFFIGGVQPKNKILDEHPRMCPSCGLHQARLKRVDHYLSVFFIPIFRIKTGTPFLECRRCGHRAQEFAQAWSGATKPQEFRCPHCGKAINPEFHYCPFCGRGL